MDAETFREQFFKLYEQTNDLTDTVFIKNIAKSMEMTSYRVKRLLDAEFPSALYGMTNGNNTIRGFRLVEAVRASSSIADRVTDRVQDPVEIAVRQIEETVARLREIEGLAEGEDLPVNLLTQPSKVSPKPAKAKSKLTEATFMEFMDQNYDRSEALSDFIVVGEIADRLGVRSVTVTKLLNACYPDIIFGRNNAAIIRGFKHKGTIATVDLKNVLYKIKRAEVISYTEEDQGEFTVMHLKIRK